MPIGYCNLSNITVLMATEKGLHLFITDDDPDDREFVIDALRKFGCQGTFTEFGNGQELYDYLNSPLNTTPDLILLDLNMPIKNGYETLRELKANIRFDSIPVVILTASSKKEDEQWCLKMGCDHFETKPLTLEGYKSLVHYVTSHIGN